MNESYTEVRPSGQHFSFDVNLASAYGIEEALLIHHFQHWIGVNKRTNKNLHDGRTWTFNTYNEIAEHFPFLSRSQVRRTIDKLVFFGVIRKGNYNKFNGDNTVWFSFEREDIFVPDLAKPKPRPPEIIPKNPVEHPLSKSSDPCRNHQTPVEIGNAIPDTKPDAKPDSKTTNPTLPQNRSIEGSVGGLQKESKKIDIYQCLQKIDIDDKDKIRITGKFDEATVSKAVAHCTKQSFKVQSSLDRSIFYFCQNPSHITQTKEDLQAQKLKEEDAQRDRVLTRKQAGYEVMKYLWKKCRELGVYIREQQDYLEISNDRINEKLYYSDNKFSNLLSHLLSKMGLESPKFLEAIA